MHPPYWPEARELLKRDTVLAELMERFPESALKGRGAPFETLVRAVVGQQISVKAADAVWGRLMAQVSGARGEVPGLSPVVILAVSDEQLRACGLSGQKVKYVRGIARGFADGTVHPGLWDGMDDEAIIAELVKLPGIGRWTAEMFLIFNLLRPDVLPLDDLGVLKAASAAFANATASRDSSLLREPATARKLKRVPKPWRQVAEDLLLRAEKWRPYRTVAVWYLWRSLDPVEVGY